MKRIALLTGILVLLSNAFFSPIARSQEPPMIEKHIFSPQSEPPVSTKKGESPRTKALEREISFTGVIISPNGKRAMIKARTRARDKAKDRSNLYKEGDEINGMTLKEIGINYVVLVREGKEVRLRLYKGDKQRPSPPRFRPEPGGGEKRALRLKRVQPPPLSTQIRHVKRPILRKRPPASILKKRTRLSPGKSY